MKLSHRLMCVGIFAAHCISLPSCSSCASAVDSSIAAPSTLTMPAALATPTKDIRLLHLRRLAVESPIEELVNQWNPWFSWFCVDYRDDLPLWHGLDRMAAWALQHEAEVPEQLAMVLVMSSVSDQRGSGSFLVQRRSDLQQLRERKRSPAQLALLKRG